MVTAVFIVLNVVLASVVLSAVAASVASAWHSRYRYEEPADAVAEATWR